MAQQGKRKKVPRAKGDHTIEECNHTVHGTPIHYVPKNAKEGKPAIEIRTNNESTSIIIPSRSPIDIPGILGKTDFNRLQKQAKVLTIEEKNAMLREAELRKQQQRMESDKRKEFMHMKQNKAPEKGSILDEAETNARKKNQYMLQRALELRQEQEDEVKTLNGIILASKCLAIREAQIREKHIIAQELENEDRRLDLMMEQNRQLAMEAEKQKQLEAEKRNKQFVNQVKDQLKANEIQALIEREKREEEARNSNKLLIAFQKTQLEELELKKKKQLQTREDLRKSNEEAVKFKQLKEEEERYNDMRIREFALKKEQDEQERKAQAAILKQVKEADIQRLGEKVKEEELIAIKREEMNLFRLQEEAERAWRNKEKEKVLIRKIAIEKLREERQKQIEDIRRTQASEICRDEEDFFKVCKVQREIYEREIEKQKERKIKAEQNRRALLKQVNNKEKQLIDRRRQAMEEGQAIRLEEEVRKMRLKETIERKLEVLKNSSIPERTLQDIRRQTEKKVMAHIV